MHCTNHTVPPPSSPRTRFGCPIASQWTPGHRLTSFAPLRECPSGRTSSEICLTLSALPKRPAPQLPAFSAPREEYEVWPARERPGDHGLPRRDAGVREPVPVPPRPRHTAPSHLDRGIIFPAIIFFSRDIRHFSLSSKCRPRSPVTPQVRGNPPGCDWRPWISFPSLCKVAKWICVHFYIRWLCYDFFLQRRDVPIEAFCASARV